MLSLSLALHAGILASAALFDLHSPGTSSAALNTSPPTSMVLLPAQSMPYHAPPTQKAVQVLTQLPVRHEDTPKPGVAVLPSKPSPAHRTPSPELILNPPHAPHLNPSGGIVFLLDVSGSMYEPFAGATRIAFAREALAQRIRALANGTPFAITVYAETAHTSGPLVAASDATRDAAIRFINEDFSYGGGTDLPAGLASAQALPPGNFVLVTDGDLNIGTTDLLGKAATILGTAGQTLSVIGISPRPDTDAETQLHALADQEGGSYSEEMSGAAPAATPRPIPSAVTTAYQGD
jgi:hypothetical protein